MSWAASACVCCYHLAFNPFTFVLTWDSHCLPFPPLSPSFPLQVGKAGEWVEDRAEDAADAVKGAAQNVKDTVT